MLNWNEIRAGAGQFAEEWAEVSKENAEAQSFWNDFLKVYGASPPSHHSYMFCWG